MDPVPVATPVLSQLAGARALANQMLEESLDRLRRRLDGLPAGMGLQAREVLHLFSDLAETCQASRLVLELELHDGPLRPAPDDPDIPF